MDADRTREIVDRVWTQEIVPALQEYVKLPAQSPGFDPEWREHGYIDRAVEMARAFVASRGLEGATIEVLRLEGHTPVLFAEIPGGKPGTVLLYGHLDKQPPFEGWREGLGPWTPVIEDGKLYGRGASDDGYAAFAAAAAMQALHEQGEAHPRVVMLIECSEESGSPDLPHYMEAYSERIGSPDLVIALDSGCGDYEHLWTTTSLRGIVAGTLTVEVLTEGVHSGDAGGIVPSSFRVARILLSRLEDAQTGAIVFKPLHVEIPKERLEQAQAAADTLGDAVWSKFPLIPGLTPVHADPATLILNRTWRPALALTGIDGVPPIAKAGNVLRPQTSLKISVRVPPTLDVEVAQAALKEALEADPPYGARVTFTPEHPAQGWAAPSTAPWLTESVERASRTYYGHPSCSMGEGGSIPFIAMLGHRFPKAQFLITGVLGPHSNAHGPNEFLHLGVARSLTCAVAQVIAEMPA